MLGGQVVAPMRNSMPARTASLPLRFELYAGSRCLGLTCDTERPVATFEFREHAEDLGARLWPSTYEIVDLEEIRP